MMRCFDLDGVFVDFVGECFIPAGEFVLGRRLDVVDESSYDLRRQLGLSDGEFREVWDSWELRVEMLHARPITSSLLLLPALGQPHAFITSRGSGDDAPAAQERAITRHWVRRVLGSEANIHSVEPQEKADVATALGAVHMWEDHPNTALQLAQAGIRVSMPVYGYNRHVHHPLVERIEGWTDERRATLGAA